MRDYDGKSKALYATLLEELKSGVISQTFVDKYRIADPDTSAAPTAKFQEYMEGLVKKILGDDYDPKVHNFRFLISVDNKPNAGILRDANPPIVILSSSLIRMLETEDQLAGILAHELTHFSINSGGNSKTEELSADVWPVFALRRAGYNPKALIEALDLISEDKEEVDMATLGGALSYLDPHPKTPFRKRTMENALFVMARDEGVTDFKVPDTPANGDVGRAVASCVHTSHIARLMKPAGYAGMTPAGKMEFLAGLIPDVFEESMRFYSERIEDLKGFLTGLPHAIRQPENAEALSHLVDRILDFKDTELSFAKDHLYDALAVNVNPGHGPQNKTRMGRLNGLNAALHAFVFASTPEEAEAAALQIKEDSRVFTFPGGNIMWHMQWPGFILPQENMLHRTWGQIDLATAGKDAAEESDIQNRKGLTPKWERQVGWALELNSPDIAQVLWAYGIKDPRLIKKFGSVLTDPAEWNQHNESYDELILSDSGKIIGRNDSYRKNLEPNNDRSYDADFLERLKGFEERRVSRINRQAERLLQTDAVDWSLLEKGDDFSAFVSRYREVLEPQVTPVDAKSPFAEAFMTHVEELLARDPGKYRPIVREFFAVTKNKPDHDRYFSRKGHEKPQLATIPDMLKNTTQSRGWRISAAPGSIYGVKLGLGFSLDSPYSHFVLEDPHRLFSAADKMEFLAGSRFIGLTNPGVFESNDYKIAVDLRKIVGYTKPATPQEFLAAVDLLEGFQYPNPNENGKLVPIYYQQKWEACDFLESHHSYLPPNVFVRVSKFNDGISGHGPFEDRLQKALEEQVKLNAVYDLKDATAEELGEAYKTYALQELFSRMPALRAEYDLALSARLQELDDPARVKAVTENLLFNIRIDDPKLRKQVVQAWVTAEVAVRGLDDESESYRAGIAGLMKEVLEKAKGFIAFEMMATLATDVQAQEKLAFLIRDGLKENLQKSATDSGGNALGIVGEFGLAALAKHDGARQDLLEFLTTPLTPESAKHFHDELEPLLNDTKSFGRAAHLQFYQAVMGYLAYSEPTEEQKLAALQTVHKNFWSLPLEGRTFFIEKILFPPEQKSEYEFHRSFDTVLDGIFPEGNKYSEMGREIVDAYLDNVPVYGQRLLLSALMVARESSGVTRTEEDVGRTLALVLVNLGPAGVKLAQAIHSHPDTPEAIRNGMSDVKGRADLPFRWDIFSRMNDAVPEEKRAEISHVGPLLGGGSFQYTLKNKLKTGVETALSLLRRNVRPRADTEFENFRATAETIIVKHPELSPLKDIISQAKNNVPVETDYGKGKIQADIARQLYEGSGVTIRGKTFRFKTVDWLDHGAEYKEASIAPGTEFNDLPEKTDEQRRDKHEVAEAIVTAELYLILSGRRFDYDRHGSNLKVDGTTVTGFDFGGMALEPPSREEKQLLGKAIAGAYKESRRKNIPFGSALISTVSGMAGDIPGSDYMASVERGVLALGDYLKVLSARDMENIVAAISKTGRIDADIMASTKQHMDMRDLSAIFMKSMFSAPTGIVIHDPSVEQATPVQPRTTAGLRK